MADAFILGIVRCCYQTRRRLKGGKLHVYGPFSYAIEVIGSSREAEEGNEFYKMINDTKREEPYFVVLTSPHVL